MCTTLEEQVGGNKNYNPQQWLKVVEALQEW